MVDFKSMNCPLINMLLYMYMFQSSIN